MPAVPSRIGGGAHGQVFLLENVATYTTRTGSTGYTEPTHPGDIDFTGTTTNGQIAQVKETGAMALESFNTQEGVRAVLRKIIITNVLLKLLFVHEDAESRLDEVDHGSFS